MRRIAAAALLALVFAGPRFAVVAAAPEASPAASATPSPFPTPPPGEPWWVPVTLRGVRTDGLRVAGGRLEAHTAAGWGPVGGTGLRAQPSPPASLGSGGPALRPGYAAVPASLQGVAVASDPSGTLWRYDPGSGWSRALLLLPASLVQGAPRVTGIAAFADLPLSDTVYVATDGFGVLESTDGGVDWIRASPGLPDSVLAIVCVSAERAVYVATADGVWVHHLRAIPAPPAYAPRDLRGYIAGTAAITVAAALLGALALRRVRG